MPFLAGLLAWFAVPTLVFAAALGAARFASRKFGLPAFRPFADAPPGATGRRLVVRSASVAAAFFVCFLLAWAAAVRNGRLEPTTEVTVIDDGPAKRDGMKDGDRIVTIDGKPVATWDALRATLGESAGPRSLGVERGHERLELTVTPTPDRRIGVEQRPKRRAASVGESASDAFRMCFAPLRAALPSPRATTELAGPVGIVKASRGAERDELGGMLALFGVFASFAWAAVVAFHAFDAVLPALRRLGN